jgi:hypothetical protein
MKPDYSQYKDVDKLTQGYFERAPIQEKCWPSTTYPHVGMANNKQIGGEHYKKHKGYEPWDVVHAWNLGYLDGTALKYIARWRDKNGVQDLQKAVHFLEKLIELEKSNETR